MASINDMVQQYTDMRQTLKDLHLELDTQWEDVELEEGDRFPTIMTELRDHASVKFEDLQTLYLNMDAKWKEVMLYFGENPKVMRPDDFFGVFARFVVSWKDAALAEEKQAQKQEREERRKHEEEQRKERLKAKRAEAETQPLTNDSNIENVDLSGEGQSEDDRRMMDNLLAKLRSGDAGETTSTLRARRRRNNHTAAPPIAMADADRMAENLLQSLQAEQ